MNDRVAAHAYGNFVIFCAASVNMKYAHETDTIKHNIKLLPIERIQN